AEHYNMIARMLARNIPVKLRVNVKTTFYDADGGNAYNVIAELPGSDPALGDEVVMIGGHLDSWHTGVGATDNADGATTVTEALRARKNTIEPIGSTDHLSFINAGVPGFNPIQEYVNYDVRTHHTNMDTNDRLQEKDIQQAAIAMAWFAYQAAMADQQIPRPAK